MFVMYTILQKETVQMNKVVIKNLELIPILMTPHFLIYQSVDKGVLCIVLIYLLCVLPHTKDKNVNINISLKDLSKIVSEVLTLKKWRRCINKLTIDCCSYVLNKLKNDHS